MINQMESLLHTAQTYGYGAEQPPAISDTVFVGFGYFCGMWVVELIAKALLPRSGSILGNARNRGILARGVTNTACFAYMGWMGLYCLSTLGGWSAYSAAAPMAAAGTDMAAVASGDGVASLLGGDQASTTYGSSARLYAYSPMSQRLVLFTLSFQSKNLIDTIVHNDGFVFVVHHVATGLLAVLALRPYLHLYAPFFFGISEISTLWIGVLVMFDENHGIKELGERFPNVMSFTGVVFAVKFILLRIVVWPLVCLHFWRDGLAQLGYYGNDTGGGSLESSVGKGVAPMHSKAVVLLFLVVNIGLTSLQVLWLKEIIDNALVLVKGGKISGSSSSSGSALKPKEA
jgi:hypothetical protein